MLNISLGYYMKKDKIYRLVGVFFLLASVVLLYFSDDSGIKSILSGLLLGAGLGLIFSGEKAFAYWKRNGEE